MSLNGSFFPPVAVFIRSTGRNCIIRCTTKAARAAIETLRVLGVAVTDISGEDFLLRVAGIKVAHAELSLGDCYAIGLSEWLKGTVVTSDKIFSRASEYTKIKQIG